MRIEKKGKENCDQPYVSISKSYVVNLLIWHLLGLSFVYNYSRSHHDTLIAFYSTNTLPLIIVLY
jgi:hypothetical protein